MSTPLTMAHLVEIIGQLELRICRLEDESMSVHELKTFRTECTDDLVVLLEKTLEKAKSGEYLSGGLIMERPQGTVWLGYSKSENIHALVAGCTYLAHGIIRDTNSV